MKETLVKFPNDEADKVPIGLLLLLKDASNTGTRIYPIELLAKGILWKFPHRPGCLLRHMDFSLQTDSKTIFLKLTPTQLFEHGEVGLVPT